MKPYEISERERREGDRAVPKGREGRRMGGPTPTERR